MNKIYINYDTICGGTDMGIEVIVYNSEPSKDGRHISASSVFNAHMLKRVSKAKVNDLIYNLVAAIECCHNECIPDLIDFLIDSFCAREDKSLYLDKL